MPAGEPIRRLRIGLANGEPATIAVLGDSAATGYGLDELRQMWLISALEDITEDEGPFEVEIAAQDGARLDDIGNQLRRTGPSDIDVAVVVIGTNDVLQLRRLPGLLSFRRRYRRLLRSVSDHAREIVATGVGDMANTPYFEQFRMLPLKPVARMASWFVNRCIEKAAADHRSSGRTVQLVRPRAVGEKLHQRRQWSFGPDGFHPNAAGHRLWAELATPVVRQAVRSAKDRPVRRTDTLFVPNRLGLARVRSVGDRNAESALVFIADAPNVVEHYDELLAELGHRWSTGPNLDGWPRALVIEMPGLGRSYAKGPYDHSLRSGADWIEATLEQERIRQVIVATSCINGFYGAKLAQIRSDLVRGLVVGQTPALPMLQAWAKSVIPWYLRWPILGTIVLRLCPSLLADRWYRRLLSDPQRSRFTSIAQRAQARGARWELGRLYRSVRREVVDPFDYLGPLPVERLWGAADPTYGDSPLDRGDTRWNRRPGVGHCVELEDPEAVLDAIEQVMAQIGMNSNPA